MKDVNTDPHILTCFVYVMSSKELICMDINFSGGPYASHCEYLYRSVVPIID